MMMASEKDSEKDKILPESPNYDETKSSKHFLIGSAP